MAEMWCGFLWSLRARGSRDRCVCIHGGVCVCVCVYERRELIYLKIRQSRSLATNLIQLGLSRADPVRILRSRCKQDIDLVPRCVATGFDYRSRWNSQQHHRLESVLCDAQ